MDVRCRIEMLGPLRMVRGGEAHTRFGAQKSAGLLAYLALRPGPHSREQIIDVFWPEMDLPDGRNNLSTALSGLRRRLEPPGVRKGAVLVTTHAQAGLDPAAVSTDVAEFDRLLRDADKAGGPGERSGLLARALALHGGGFQPGNYHDWAVREAERLEERRVAALDALADDLEALGRYDEAAAVTRQRLAADPYAEAAQVGLIRRQVRAGRPAAARKASQEFERLFQEEFGAGPDAETRRAIREILAQPARPPAEAPPPQASPAPVKPGARDSPEDGPEDTAGAKGVARKDALPFWLNSFFGREPEMAQLAALLLPSKEGATGIGSYERPARLLTLSGPGGAGKTRLAAEFGRRASERFGHWCGFVPLDDLSGPDQIPARIAQSLRLTPSPTTPPLEQVVSFLVGREGPAASPALLILDNLEHLLGPDGGPAPPAAGIVRTLLGATTGLVVLCTSRRPLGIGGERLLPLGPLPVPEAADPAADLAELAGIPSVRLYVDRAQAVRPDFGLTPTNAPAVAALCRVLEGSPLALELAASWVRQTPPRRMWERLSHGLEMPEGRQADLPARHRSLAAALDWSWRLLPPPQRRLLGRLSVFRGGWTLEAAESACAEPEALELLAALEEASLVTAREDAGGDVRYSLLETVRQYAAQRLAEEGAGEQRGVAGQDAGAVAQGRHLAWCLALALDADAEMRGPQQGTWLTRLEAEHDNLRAALEWSAREHGLEDCHEDAPPAPLGLRLSGALGLFWLLRGHLQEGRTHAAALARPDAQAPTQARADALQSAALLANEQGDFAAARSQHEGALVIRRALGDPMPLSLSLNNLAIAVYDQGDSPAARMLWEEALAVARQAGYTAATACALANLGELAFEEGDADTGRPLLEEALALHRTKGSKFNIAYVLKVLATLTHQQGDLTAARRFLAESLPIQHDIGHLAGIAQTLEAAAALAMTSGRADLSANLAGAAAALREEIAAPLPANERCRHEKDIAAARAALGEAAFSGAFTLGRAMTWQQAAGFALTSADGSP